MNKKVTITLPDELTLHQYSQLHNLEHLSEFDKVIAYISVTTGISVEEIKTYDLLSITKISSDIQNLTNIKPIFHPIFEYKNVIYGYQPVSKMTVGEISDLSNLCKNTSDNLSDIFALLYRPITKNKIGSFEWMVKTQYKYKIGKAENLFKYYEVEKYEFEDRFERAEILKDAPVGMCMGALDFFLGSVALSINATKPYLDQKQVKMTMRNLQQTTGVGLEPYVGSPKPIYFQLQETKQ
jgi:hypothetical protein